MWTWINILQKPVYPIILRAVPLLLLAGMGSGQVSTPAFADVGLLPTPTLQDVQVNAEVSFDVGTQLYTYTYTVGNPGTNTGDIWNIRIDITDPLVGSRFFDTAGLTIPHGGNFFPFDEELAELQPLLDVPPGTIVVPVGQRVPSGWNGGLDKDGLAGFHSSGPSVRILPGQILTGFEVISPGLPTIRKVQVHPFWVLLVDNIEAVTPEEEMAAREIEQAIIFHTFTLGPSALEPGTVSHWDRLRDDLNQAIEIGWIPDTTLANTLVTQLAFAREALDVRDGTLANSRLQPLIETITGSTLAQRRREVADLVLLNVVSL